MDMEHHLFASSSNSFQMVYLYSEGTLTKNKRNKPQERVRPKHTHPGEMFALTVLHNCSCKPQPQREHHKAKG